MWYFLELFLRDEIEIELEGQIFSYRKSSKVLEIRTKDNSTELETVPDVDLIWNHDDKFQKSTFVLSSNAGEN